MYRRFEEGNYGEPDINEAGQGWKPDYDWGSEESDSHMICGEALADAAVDVELEPEEV